MGKGVVENGALDEACAECRVVCQTTHGKDSPCAVPRFFKAIVEHSTPSSTNCHLQVPAAFIRTHIGLSKREKYVVVGAQGCEWAMTFNTIGFRTGWKEFSTAYQLETGDGIMLSLFAPKRFYANVFDKYGIEKFGSKQTRNSSKELQVSNSMNGGGGAEDLGAPLDSNGTHLHREGKSNASHHHPVGTSGQNGHHDNRTLPMEKHHPFPNEPVDHEADPSSMSPSSDDSEDSIQVRLAKSVLAKAKQKKLKKRMKSSCTSTPQAAEGVITQMEGTTVGAAEGCQNDDRADGRSNVNPTDSPLRNAHTPAAVDDAMFENPCEELRALANGGPSLVVGAFIGVPNVEEVNTLQVESQPGKVPQGEEEETPLPQTATVESVPLRRVEFDRPAEDRPSPVFMPGLVKQEPDLSPLQTCGNCNHCGKRKEAPTLGRTTPPKPEPLTTNSPSLDFRTPEARSPSSNPPRVTEAQKQRANAVASKLSKNTKNPNALVVGRVSMSKPDRCFLSNMCSEMLPSLPTELTLLDTEGNAQRVNWKPNQRIMDGPGWKYFVDSHNLQADDFWVMEVVDSSEHNVVIKAHIFHSHEMESTPERAVREAPAPTDSAKTTPAVPAKTPAVQAKTPAVPVSPDQRPVLGTPAPALGTGTKTRSSNQLHGPVASSSKTRKRARAPNMDESALLEGSPRSFRETPRPSELPSPVATKAAEDDRALTGQPRPKRLRRGSSYSASTPRRGIAVSSPTSGTGQTDKPARTVRQQAARRHSLDTALGPRKSAMAGVVATPRRGESASKGQGRGGGGSSAAASASADEPGENPKQVRTRNSQRKTPYKVSKVIDRRKSLQGVVFLVELMDRVRPESLAKRMKAQQDEKGRWWVPHHHFNHNLSACYLE